MNLLFQSYKTGQILAASLDIGLFTFLNVLILRDSVAVSMEAPHAPFYTDCCSGK